VECTVKPGSNSPDAGETRCDICKLPLEGTRIGHGDGTGQRFAHPECYYREKHSSLLSALEALAGKWESIGTTSGPEVVKGAFWKRTVWRDCAKDLRALVARCGGGRHG
jgi:hypothetical protein